MNRRKFIGNSIIGTVGAGFLGGIYAWQVEPFWLEFVEREMPVKNLPPGLEGKTLMQISDMHVGNRFNYQYIIDSLKKAKIFKPDIVMYTGDYTTYEGNEQFEQLDEVLNHTIKGKMGTIGILGNHDYGHNWSENHVAHRITRQLEGAGIEVLRNQKTNIEGLDFLGFDDYWGLNFNPAEVMKEYNPSTPTIALCHNPDVCDLDIWNNFKGWILSGHTHGGQLKPPFLTPPMLPVTNKRYTCGAFDLNDGRNLYINRALGHLIQVRLNVRPEITVFRLERV